MSIKEDEKALMTLDEEIRKSSNKALQLERADATDIDSFKALQLEKQFLGNLEKKRLEVRKRLEEEKEEAKKLTSRFEMLAASLESKYEEVAQPFIERLTDYLEKDLREEFIEIYSQLEALHSEATTVHNKRETIKGGSGYGLPLLPGANQFTFNTRVAKLLDSWEYNTRNQMIGRAKEAQEAKK